jgi:hypothetical protein
MTRATPAGFDFSYINPLIFLRPVEAANGSPDNALIGLTSKLKVTNGLTLYGQFALDEFESKNFFHNPGNYRNKFGWQLGIRGADLFGVKGLKLPCRNQYCTGLTLIPSVHQSINYTANSEPLAHPFGANFREYVAMLNYSYKRFDFSGEADLGQIRPGYE